MLMELNQTTNVEEHDDGTDKLSDMPDNVLCKILSCLPTKDAVATKILSTRWGRSLDPFFWVPPIVLDLDDIWLSHDSFQKFMDKLLHEFQVNVDMLKLTCRNECDEKKMSWISSGLQLNIRELSLEWSCLASEKELPLIGILNGHTSLTRLVLHKGIDGNRFILRDDFISPNLRTLVLSHIKFMFAESNFILHNLRTLDLYKVGFTYRDEGSSLNGLINGCPLECLSLRHCMFTCCPYEEDEEEDEEFLLYIRCPQLKDLTMEKCSGCSFEIDVPNLKEFRLKHYAHCTILSNFKSLLSAHIDVGYNAGSDIVDLVTACSSTVDLYLGASVIDDLPAKLTMFKNLNRLTLGHLSHEGWAILACLLYNAPKLEKLTFEQGFSPHDGWYTLFESLVARRPPLSCMELHIREIEFCVFDESEDEMKLVEYFMSEGKVIETLKLGCKPFKNESTLGRLSTLPSHESKLVFQLRQRGPCITCSKSLFNSKCDCISLTL